MRRFLPVLLLLAAGGASAAARPAGPAEPAAPTPHPAFRFVDVTAGAGLDFVHTRGGTNPVVIFEEMGPGAAFLDHDGDGDLDLYLLQSSWKRVPDPEKKPAPTNRLYRNDGRGADGVPRFTDVTKAAGVADPGYGLGSAVGDIDNDGDPDLYVTNYGSNVLYLNQGDGTFRDVTRLAGADDPLMSHSAAFADVDGDGRLDLYVANYIDYESGPEFCDFEGVRYACSDLEYTGAPNSLFLNLGPGEDGVPRFREAAEERGIRDPTGRGLGVTFGDLDNDGDIDLYVANDGGGNKLFLNDGKGTFKDWTLISGTGYSEAGMGEAGMGTALGDFNNDGLLDIIVTNFARETNALYRNDGGAIFTYATVTAQMHRPTFLRLGWGLRFFDADLDGDEDLFVVYGHLYEQAPLLNPQDKWLQPNQLFRNNGDGTLTDVSEEAGPGLEVEAVSRGLALGDVDNDGDLDLYVANNHGIGTLLLNETDRGDRHALRLRLTGGPSNRDAVGSRLTVRAGELKLVRQVTGGGSYLSSGDLRPLIGVGTAERADVEIRWPSGVTQRFENLPVDVPIHLTEGKPAEIGKGTP
jgi:hypothetical protein